MPPGLAPLGLAPLDRRDVPALFPFVTPYSFLPAGDIGSSADLPKVLAAVDLTGDGKPDLVTTNEARASVHVLVNDGGRFGSPRVTPVNPVTDFRGTVRVEPRGFATADFNRDGRLDLVTAGGNASVVFLGDGAGGFTAQLPFDGTRDVAAGDFTGDGNPDVIGNGRLYVGDGTGQLGPVREFFGTKITGVEIEGPLGDSTLEGFVVADFNADGKPDVAALRRDSGAGGPVALVAALGDGAGRFPTARQVPVPSAFSAHVADLTGDGKLDVVVLGLSTAVGPAPEPRPAFLLAGDGAGGFGPATPVDLRAGAATVSGLAAGDVNADGRPDLVTAVSTFNIRTGSRDEVGVLLNDGAGGFAGPDLSLVYDGPEIRGSRGPVLVADLSGDGSPEVVLPGYVLSRQGGTGPVTPPAAAPTLVGYREFGAATGSPGAVDVVYFNPDRSVRYAFDVFPGFGGVRTAAADFTRDGVADLVVGTGPGMPTRVAVLDGTTKAELFAIAPFEASFLGGVYVAAGDLDGDGVPELVITPDEGGGPRVRVFSGKGFGLHADFFGIDDVNFRGGARAAVGDINGDGAGDLIVAAGFQGGPRVAGFDGRSVGTGTPVRVFGDFFAFEQALRNGVFVAVGDLDGDGFAELIAGGGPGGGPRVTAFSGKALLANQQDVRANFFAGDPENRGGVRLAVKDLDGDARADLVTGAGANSGSVTAYLGKAISPAGVPPEHFRFDVFTKSFGGVFVG